MQLLILQSIAKVLDLITSPSLPRGLEANKQSSPTAENALKQEATKPQYSLSLLNIVNSDSLPLKTRLAAALAFKNFIRTSYVVRLVRLDRSFPKC
jgi:hypothetical protein